MKYINYILCLFFTFGLMGAEKKKNLKFSPNLDIVFSIEVSDSNALCDSIKLVFNNNSNKYYRISNPNCLGNTYCKLINSDGKIVESNRFRVNLECMNQYVDLHPNTSYCVNYDYNLYKLYGNLQPGYYQVSMTYYGKIMDCQGTFIKNDKINSSNIKIKI